MRAALLTCFLLLAGCAHEKVAGPPGAAPAAGASVALVRVEVQSEQPIEEGLVQLRVTIQNGTGIPIRLRYDQMALIAAGGLRLPPMAPLSGAGARFHDLTPLFESSGLCLPPEGVRVFPQLVPCAEPFEPRAAGVVIWPDGLPTEQIVAQAIPEGVLEKGGRVSGLLFFPALPEILDRALLEARLVAAGSGETFATIDIPLMLATPPKP